MRKARLFFIALLSAIGLSASAEVQAVDELQAFIDQLASSPQTRATGVTDVDLSNPNYSVPRTSALEIRNGVKVRFVNGTLKSADTYEGCLLRISGDSYLELASTAILSPGLKTNYAEGLVEMTGGQFYINGGTITSYRTSSGTKRIATLIKTNENSGSSNYIKMNSGSVDGYISSHYHDAIVINGGYLYKIYAYSTEAYIVIGGDAQIKEFSSLTTTNNVCPEIVSALQHDIKFTYRSTNDNIIAMGERSRSNVSNYPQHITKSSNDNLKSKRIVERSVYSLTSNDINHIKAYQETYINGNLHEELMETYLESNCAKVRTKTGISNADDLQRLLDDIAARGVATEDKPETITIPANGITIDKCIWVRSKCHAVLTGGPIKIDIPTYGHCAFLIEDGASLKLTDISFDCNRGTDVTHYFYVYGGKLYVGYNVKFINNNITQHSGFCYLGLSGEIEYWPRQSVFKSANEIISGTGYVNMYGSIESAGCAINASDVLLCWGTVTGGGDVVIKANNITVTETGTTIKSSYNGVSTLVSSNKAEYLTGTYVGSNVKILASAIISGHLKMPTLLLCDGAVIEARSALENEWVIDCCTDWSKYAVETTIVKGAYSYILTQADFNKMKFINLPENREAYYDTVSHSVKLRVAFNSSDPLQEFIDGLGDDDKGTEDDPVVIKPGVDGIDIDKDIDNTDDLQALIDGLADNGKDYKEMRFNGGNIYIRPGGCFTFRNIYLNGCNGKNHIYVYGTLIIDINVYVHGFIDKFIHVCPGGRIIWRNGNSEGTSKIIYNEGGTVDIYGGTISGGGNGCIVNINGTINIYGGNNGTSGTTVNGYVINGDSGHTSGTIHIYDGTVISGGITNYGTLIVDGGTINGGGSYGITNYGDLRVQGGTVTGYSDISIWTHKHFYLCGCANVGDIYLAKGARINITERLTVKIRIHFIVDGGFELGTPIVIGIGGYALTDDDVKLIEVVLPNGFKWEYDKTLRAIIIKSTSGIEEITSSDESETSDIYNLYGVKVGKVSEKNNLPDGLYVINGKTVMLKQQ